MSVARVEEAILIERAEWQTQADILPQKPPRNAIVALHIPSLQSGKIGIECFRWNHPKPGWPTQKPSDELPNAAQLHDAKLRVAEYQQQQIRGLIRFLPIFATTLALIGTATLEVSLIRGKQVQRKNEIVQRLQLEHDLEVLRQQLVRGDEAAKDRVMELVKANADLQAELKKLQRGQTTKLQRAKP